MNQRVGFLNSNRDKWILIVSFGLFGFGFLTFFRPFGIDNYNPEFQLSAEFVIVTFSFGLSTMITLILTEFFIRKSLRFAWTFRNMLLWYFGVSLLCASVSFLFYNLLGNWHDMRWASYLEFLVDIPVMSFIPFSLLILYFNYREAKLHLAYEQGKDVSRVIQLTSSNGKEVLAVPADSLILVESQENYVAVYFVENEQIRKKLLRSTLTNIEKQLSSTTLRRCHRSFLINMSKVARYHESPSRSEVSLEGIERSIPVSASYRSLLQR